MNTPPVTTIAITGGPSAGKTTLIHTLQKEFKNQIATVPETASILYHGGFFRSDNLEVKVHIQRAIYFVQLESEAISKLLHPNKSLVLDRGTLDGLAYWPYTSQAYFNQLGTTLEREIKRYEWVIHMDSAFQEGYDSNNPIRIESPKEALRLNENIKKVWVSHPQRFIIGSSDDFIRKIRLAKNLIRQILKGNSYSKINSYFARFLVNN